MPDPVPEPLVPPEVPVEAPTEVPAEVPAEEPAEEPVGPDVVSPLALVMAPASASASVPTFTGTLQPVTATKRAKGLPLTDRPVRHPRQAQTSCRGKRRERPARPPWLPAGASNRRVLARAARPVPR